LLTSDEHATEELKGRVAEEYKERFERHKREFEDQILEQEKKHRLEIGYAKKIHNDHIASIQQDLKTVQDTQIADLKKRYNELNILRQKDFDEKILQILTYHKKEVDEKDNRILKDNNS
jgi:hypothetical protein